MLVPNATSVRELDITIAMDGLSRQHGTRTVMANVTIMKNSVPWKSFAIDDVATRLVIHDDAAITGTSYTGCIQKDDGSWYIHERSITPVNPSTLNTGGADYYYVRVSDSNGGAAWIGPIWVQVA